MTDDDLRTRLAAAIYDAVAWRIVNVPVAEEIADVVIAEYRRFFIAESSSMFADVEGDLDVDRLLDEARRYTAPEPAQGDHRYDEGGFWG